MGKVALAGFAASLLVSGSMARAATIVLVDDGTVAGTAAEQGFAIAAAYWSSVLANDVTVRIGVGYDSLGEGIIGQTGSARMNYTAAKWEAGVNKTKSSYSLDSTAVLPTLNGGAISMITSGPSSGKNGVNAAANKRVYDTDKSTNNKILSLDTANVKAIGGTAVYTGDYAAQKLDADITFSSNFGFDFNPTDGISPNTFDFIATAIHEMGHALGFVSGVDYYDQIAGYGPFGAYVGGNLNQTAIFSALDMFRYSADPTNKAPGTTPVLDFAVGSPSYFSIDGGKTQLFGDSLLATGVNFGDGDQASHWKDVMTCYAQRGIMDPTECYAQPGEITALDLAAFDAIGWNLNFDVLKSGYLETTSSIYRDFSDSNRSFAMSHGLDTFTNGFAMMSAVPEPATWAEMMVGFGLLGASLRRRLRSVRRAEVFLTPVSN